MTSTLPAPAPVDAPPADILNTAADLLTTHGLHPSFWRHGVYVREYWPDERAQPWRPGLRLSLVGAVGVALGLTDRHDVTEHVIPCVLDPDQPSHPAVDALRGQIGATSLPDLLGWCDWSTGPHIAATMRDCAGWLRDAVTCISCGVEYGQSHASWCEFR